MATYKKTAMAVAALVVAGGAVALAAPAFGSKTPKPTVHSAFGIKSTESIYGYQRQPGWHETANHQFAVTPPRPEADFSHYAVLGDPETHKVCGVVATTESEPALTRLKASLAQTYGEPTVTPANGWRWSKGADFVEVEDIDTLYHVLWDFTGTCFDKNRGPDPVTAAIAQ